MRDGEGREIDFRNTVILMTSNLGSDLLMQQLSENPTCAPLYMASKPGFTHLPICSGNQY